jgi:hypothetical protein
MEALMEMATMVGAHGLGPAPDAWWRWWSLLLFLLLGWCGGVDGDLDLMMEVWRRQGSAVDVYGDGLISLGSSLSYIGLGGVPRPPQYRPYHLRKV